MDLPSILSTSAPTTTTAPAGAAVPVTVVQVPPNLTAITRLLETQGQATLIHPPPSMPNAAQIAALLTLATPTGSFTLALPHTTDTPAHMAVIRDLIAQQKPLPFVVQPGSPPTTALLMLSLQVLAKGATLPSRAAGTVAPSLPPSSLLHGQTQLGTTQTTAATTFFSGMTLPASIIRTHPSTAQPSSPTSPQLTDSTARDRAQHSFPHSPGAAERTTPHATAPQSTPPFFPQGLTTADIMARFHASSTVTPQAAQLTLHTRMLPAETGVPPHTRPSAPTSASIATLIGTTRDGHDVFQINRSIVSIPSHLQEAQGTRFLASLSTDVAASTAATHPSPRISQLTHDPALANKPDIVQIYQALLAAHPDNPDDSGMDGVMFDEADLMARSVEAATHAPPNTLSPQAAVAQLPRANAALPASLLFFLAAVQSGGDLGWIPANRLDSLMQQSKQLGALKSVRESAKASPPTEDSQGELWQRYSIPILHEGVWHFVHLSLHNREHPAQSSLSPSNAPRIRFLVDVRMSKLGSLQLDGLCHKKRLDMMIRSEAQLPTHLITEIQSQYTLTLQALGLHGTVTMEAGGKGWVSFPNRLMRPTHA